MNDLGQDGRASISVAEPYHGSYTGLIEAAPVIRRIFDAGKRCVLDRQAQDPAFRPVSKQEICSECGVMKGLRGLAAQCRFG